MKPAAVLSDPEFPRLKERIIESTGLAYYADKDSDLAGRVARRIETLGLRDCGAYRRLLQDAYAGAAEMKELVAEITVGETYFLRQAEAFELLRRTVIPAILERNRANRRLRIWSAGCATGAEPYSLSILLREDFGARTAGWSLSILGTDINPVFLERARAARFDNWAFRETPADFKNRYFERHDKQWTLRPEYREGVSFAYHNLISDPSPGSAFDLILCRNVMIYFSAPVVRATVDRLHASLAPGGWLLVGHAEPNTEVFRAFRTVSESGVSIYQKPERAAAPLEITLPPPPAAAPAAPPPRPLPPEPAPKPRIDLAGVRSLADRGDWEAAASGCRALLEAGDLDAPLHFTLGLILEHTGPPAEARRALRRAVFLDRGFGLAHYHLGVLQQREGDARQARRSFENVLQSLAGVPDTRVLEHGDGITAAELREMARMHLEILGVR